MLAGSSSSFYPSHNANKMRSIKSDDPLDLRGPMEVDGSVKSMSSVTFRGDFSVKDRIEAYGDVDIQGNLSCGYVSPIVI